jgi:hypothetical protein
MRTRFPSPKFLLHGDFMARSPEAKRDLRVSEEDAHELLVRAAELDARLPTTVHLPELWSAAAQAGISREAFELATAELQAGKIGHRRRRLAIRPALVRSGQVAIATAMIVFALSTPDYSGWWIAQSLAMGCAVYGAYKAIGAVGRWTRGLSGLRRAVDTPDAEPMAIDRPTGDASLAVCVFTLQQRLCEAS